MLGALPLLFVSPHQLTFLYESWARLLAVDQAASTGVSVMSWLHNWFGFDPPANVVVGAGMMVMLVPLLRVRAYADPTFRALVLAALLIWIVIFNHKAEPNTFVIATAGVAVWFFARAPSRLRLTLLSGDDSLTLPMIAVGLRWERGYCVQRIGPDGQPFDEFPGYDSGFLEDTGVRVRVRVRGAEVRCVVKVTRRFGNATLLLIEPERDEDRWITHRLYQAGTDVRIDASGVHETAAPAEHVSKASVEDVGWPLDLNKPKDRENVDKAVSFHDL